VYVFVFIFSGLICENSISSKSDLCRAFSAHDRCKPNPGLTASLLPKVNTEAIVCHLAPLSYRAKDPNGNSTLQAMR
jgi:hypothetical protein